MLVAHMSFHSYDENIQPDNHIAYFNKGGVEASNLLVMFMVMVVAIHKDDDLKAVVLKQTLCVTEGFSVETCT